MELRILALSPAWAYSKDPTAALGQKASLRYLCVRGTKDSAERKKLDNYGDFGSSLRDLPRLRDSRRRRASSWDRSGGNDRLHAAHGARVTLVEMEGMGPRESAEYRSAKVGPRPTRYLAHDGVLRVTLRLGVEPRDPLSPV